MRRPDDFAKQWIRAGRWRRIGLIGLIFTPTFIATGFMAQVLPDRGQTPIEMLVLFIYAVLYAWISIGFWTAGIGCLIHIRGKDRFAISRLIEKSDTALAQDCRIAIVMPIYNESIARVSAGISATLMSLYRTGSGSHFDFFILADPGDPSISVDEELAWWRLQKRFHGKCRIYYRRRAGNIKRKSGNIADFCRRWGKNYRYMIVMDADSFMTGSTIVRMAAIMEKRPAIGILQTSPKTVNRHSLLARMQQFTNSLYGPMFAAGLNFWQLGDSQYWGHNAIIRIKPFMQHCALPILSGHPPLGGEILSHDFVEAAFMRRAGYEIWLAYDLDGSYEEMPITLFDELKRDRRWCQGNLQHMRLLFTRGLYGAHRFLFINGAMSYISAILWFFFLAASSVMAILHEIREPDYFPNGPSLFPSWPVWEPQWALVLLASTICILFLPKILIVVYTAVRSRRARFYGGRIRLLTSFLLEIALSTLLSPIRMVFHAQFVFITLSGRKTTWSGQHREDHDITFAEAFRFHWVETLFGLLWGVVVFTVNRSFFWWLSPIIVSLLISIPLSVWTSRDIGHLNLFLIPEEIAPPRELTEFNIDMDTSSSFPMSEFGHLQGFIRAVVDPTVHAFHVALFTDRKKNSPIFKEQLSALCDQTLREGPGTLSLVEKRMLLSDADSMQRLHREVWKCPDETVAAAWGL